MSKISSFNTSVRNVVYLKKSSSKNKCGSVISLIKALRKVTNSCAKIKVFTFKKPSPKVNINSVHLSLIKNNLQAINSKVTREFISMKLIELDITGNAKRDPVYARQACDAALASVYSNKKDAFCKQMVSKGIDTSGFLMEAGNAAYQAGLEGKIDSNNIFIPTGAGANPFVSAVISSAQLKFPYAFLNKKQQLFFKQYAEKKISCEMGGICKDCGLISPDDFGVMLEKIASRYILS